jgi:hypothetical protein
MNDEAKKIRILAVDDHLLLREGIASLIADEHLGSPRGAARVQ